MGRAAGSAARTGEDEEERRWIAAAARGDEAAFRRLVERHRDRAYGLALRIVRSPADAEEVAADAFVRVWRALPAFRGEASFATWLHRIVARRALDREAVLRHRRKRETWLEDGVEPRRSTPGSQEETADRGLRARRIGALLEGLPAVRRAVVTLYYLEDASIEAVSVALGIPEGTVKTHLHRARSALRAAWLRDEEKEKTT